MNTEIRFGHAEEYQDFLDFINYVFGFNGKDSSFLSLIPHYYLPQCHPEKNNLVLTEDGKIRAAVGLFPHALTVGGETLRCVGIGNVAVHPACRGKGYMKALMACSMEEMRARGADLGVLDGRRHRYLHFSYERAGAVLIFRVTDAAMQQCFPAGRTSRFDLREIGAEDTVLLNAVHADIGKSPVVPDRDRASLWLRMTGHHGRLFALTESGEYRGYVQVSGDRVSELSVLPQDFSDMLIAVFDGLGRGSVTFRLAPWQTEYIRAIFPLYDGYTVESLHTFTVLSFARVLRAFLRLRRSYETLPEGEVRVLIHGVAGDEALRLYVGGKDAGVTPCDPGECTAEFSHEDAIRAFFQPYAPQAVVLPPEVRAWLPLPIWLYPAEDF